MCDIEKELTQIEDLRAQGGTVDAFHRTLDLLERVKWPSQKHAIWLTQFEADQCLLLDFAKAARERPNELEEGLHRLSEGGTARPHLWYAFAFSESIGGIGERSLAALDARILTLRAWRSGDSQQIVEAVRAYQNLWDCPQTRGSQTPAPEPGVFRRMQEEDSRSLFSDAAERFGWYAPGVLLARDTLRYVADDPQSDPSDFAVETWVLFAQDDPRKPEGSRGQIGRLRLERVADGRGGLYPHPVSAGYLLAADDFRQSFAHAWFAVFDRIPPPFDVRWSLRIRDDCGVPVPGEVRARSAEVAIATALRALRDGEELDRHVAVTAMLKNPMTQDNALDPVGGVDLKLMAALKRKMIDELLVAEKQSELVIVGDGHIQLTPVKHLEEVYEQLTRYGRMTRTAKESMAREAEKDLAKK